MAARAKIILRYQHSGTSKYYFCSVVLQTNTLTESRLWVLDSSDLSPRGVGGVVYNRAIEVVTKLNKELQLPVYTQNWGTKTKAKKLFIAKFGRRVGVLE